MPVPTSEMIRIEADAALVRTRLRRGASEIFFRAHPKTVTADLARRLNSATSGLGTKALKDVSSHGWKWIGAAGALGLSFELGRQSRGDRRERPQAQPMGSREDAPARAAPPRPFPVLGFVRAAALGSLGLLFGFAASSLVPPSDTEKRYLASTGDRFREQLHEFLNQYSRGIQSAAFNMFGLSRYSALALTVLSLLGTLSQSRSNAPR